MTWQKKFEIPPKPGTFQLAIDSILISSFRSFLKNPFRFPFFKHLPQTQRFLQTRTKPKGVSSFVYFITLSLSLENPNPRRAEGAMKGGKSKADTGRTDARLKAKKKTTKKAKDPNKPKRPPSAFFVFMEEFRQQFKEKHPNNKSVAAVGKAAGDKWKSMSDAEKAPYVSKADKRKTEYNKNMAAYNKKIADGGNGDNDSDKSKSEVNDEDEEEEEEEDEEEED